jgi:hypothetical protein
MLNLRHAIGVDGVVLAPDKRANRRCGLLGLVVRFPDLPGLGNDSRSVFRRKDNVDGDRVHLDRLAIKCGWLISPLNDGILGGFPKAWAV